MSTADHWNDQIEDPLERRLYNAVWMVAENPTAVPALEALRAAALAYARPIVAEECAKIVESIKPDTTHVPWILQVMEHDLILKARVLIERTINECAAAIREHGRKT